MRRAGKLIAGLMLVSGVVAFAASAWGQTVKIPQRNEIDKKFKWNLGGHLLQHRGVGVRLRQGEGGPPEALGHAGAAGDSRPEALHGALVLRDSLWNIVDRLYVYANMKLDEDSRVADYQVLSDKASLINTEMSQRRLVHRAGDRRHSRRHVAGVRDRLRSARALSPPP